MLEWKTREAYRRSVLTETGGCVKALICFTGTLKASLRLWRLKWCDTGPQVLPAGALPDDTEFVCVCYVKNVKKRVADLDFLLVSVLVLRL